jgi:hypothetical protein
MSNISNFNSLWEIGFSVNAIFVYFELTPILERKFNSFNAIGRKIIDEMIEENDRKYINTYGWRNILFSYAIWVSRLQAMSALNTIAAIFLIIVAGFNPELVLRDFSIALVILILFTPIVVIPVIILYGLPLYKLKCIEEAAQKILERDNSNPETLAGKTRKYRTIIEYIKLTEFSRFPLVKRNKEFSDDEIFQTINEYRN